MPAPSHRARFAVGVLLATALGSWLTHRFAQQAVRTELAGVERRQAVVQLQALTTLAQRAGEDGEALRRAVAEWQKVSGAAQARVMFIGGARLEASTAPGDTGENAAPRRLKREEKPFYDQAQRLASAVSTNAEEGAARKPEIEVGETYLSLGGLIGHWVTLAQGMTPPAGESELVAALNARRLGLAAPVESGGAVVGMVQTVTSELRPEPRVPIWPYLLALIAAVAVFAGGALLLGRRRRTLAPLALICVAGSLYALLRLSTGQVQDARRGAAQAVADELQKQAALVRSLSPSEPVPMVAWDVDAYRKPLGLLTSEGKVDHEQVAAAGRATDSALRKSLLAAGGLSLAVLLIIGLGGASALGSTLRRHRQAYLYIAPAMIGMLILVFFPFFYGITLSFTGQTLYNTDKSLSEIWVGLANYASILGDFDIVKHGEGGTIVNYLNFYWTLGFTIVWTVTNVALGVTSGLILALILNTKGLAMRPLYRVLLILPWAMPNYITALIWKGMFHRQFGVVNQLLQMFGMDAISWFDRPFTSYLTALATNGWLSFPFMMVVSLGALQSIPADLYEAARVDGASRWQAFRAITLPSLRPALVPAVIISVVWTFNMFNIIYLVTGGQPSYATEILVTQSYKFAFEKYQYGYAAAYSTVIFGILLIYGIIQNRVSKATEA